MKKGKSLIATYSAVTAILIVLVMTVLNVTLINVALPAFAEDFGVSDSNVVWVVTAYQLVVTSLLLPMSSIGDLYSYKRIFLVGVFFFTVASLLCGLSTGFAMLVAMRIIQGVGAACIMAVTVALIRLIYPPEQLGRGLALNAMVIAIATAAGPALSGVILSTFSWHWLFYINLPFGIAAFTLGYRLLPSNRKREDKESFDYLGAIENIFAFGLTFYALGGFSKGNNPVLNLVLLFVGLTIGFFYLRRQCGRKYPMFPVDLFRNKVYTLSIFTSVNSFIAQSSAMVALPFLFINRLGFTEVLTGLLMTPWPIATLILSPLIARYVEHHSAGKTASIGMAIYAIGLILLILIPEEGVNPINIVWRMAVCGIGYGFFQTPNNIVMIGVTPLHRSGGAGGMQGTARLSGQTLGALIVTILFALVTDINVATVSCLWAAVAFAVIAGIFSISRVAQ